MNRGKAFFFVVLLFFVSVACSSDKVEPPVDPPVEPPEKEDHHPFLIVSKDQFQSLRDKSDAQPWKAMKEDAISRSGKSVGTEPYDLQYYVGAAALAYILDEEKAQSYAHKVRDAILNKYSKVEFKDGSSWGGVVPPMGSAFVAILALDIVYDALTAEEILDCETVISEQIFKIGRSGSWIDARLGTHGAWDIYKGDRTGQDNAYYNSVMDQITEDGVSPVTNHYAWERVGGGNSRISKSGYMDVLEFTGIDNRFYNNERLQKFQKWLFGSSINCAKEMAIFGDMLPTQGISNDMLHRRVVNFDMEAAGYAAWFYEGRPAYGNILTYIIPKQELPAPIVPSSKLFENGGAFFREPQDDPDGLHAVLYNIKSQDEWHTHQEVNGLALSGFGNRLLVNGGRLGEPTRAANLNNTLTINGDDHQRRIGGGIVEGFSADGFDYSSGNSGTAIQNADHFRNLILIHETDQAAAYFILFDEVQAQAGDQVRNYLHPANQSSVTTVSAEMEYLASIDHYPTKNGTSLSFFFATPPSNVNIELVASAVPDRYPDYPDHNRLESRYNVDGNGKLNLVTVILPHNASITKPTFSRVSDANYTGSGIDHGSGVVDLAIESTGDQEFANGNVSANGKSLVVRSISGTNHFYFVRHGTKFDEVGVGFESDAPVSIYAKGKDGVIFSEGAKIKLMGEGMNTVNFVPAATIIDSGADFIEVQLPAGETRFSGS